MGDRKTRSGIFTHRRVRYLERGEEGGREDYYIGWVGRSRIAMTAPAAHSSAET